MTQAQLNDFVKRLREIADEIPWIREQDVQKIRSELRAHADSMECNAEWRRLLAKAYAIMEHLGERLNEHDLAFDDEHLDTITADWEAILQALKRSPVP